MDTSETYVKMRLAASHDLGMGTPPQITYRPDVPRRWVDVKNNVWIDERGNFYYSTSIHAVQLERQDQLQDMVEKRNTRELLMRFTDWVEKETDYRRESMEQLWLSFVMHEKYGKHWNGEDWVKAR